MLVTLQRSSLRCGRTCRRAADALDRRWLSVRFYAGRTLALLSRWSGGVVELSSLPCAQFCRSRLYRSRETASVFATCVLPSAATMTVRKQPRRPNMDYQTLFDRCSARGDRGTCRSVYDKSLEARSKTPLMRGADVPSDGDGGEWKL